MDVLNEVTENYEHYLVTKADLLKIPLVGVFELSPLCNLNCEMCYIRQKTQEVRAQGGLLPKEFWIEKAEQAKRCDTLYILLTGGEPFLYPEFKELYIALHQMGLYITINTNATLINEETIEWLTKYPPRRLNISMYGSSNDTYEKLCKDKYGFDKFKNAVTLLKKNNIMMRISYVRCKENVNDYDDIVSFCNENRLYLSVSNYMFPSIRKYSDTQSNKGRLNPIDAALCSFQYIKDSHGTTYYEYLHSFAHRQCEDMYKEGKVICRAGTSTFWLNWKGEMLPCGMMVEPSISVKNKSISEGWHYIREQVEQIYMSEKCSNCTNRKYCGICAAAAYAETGAFNGTPEYLCEMTENLANLLELEWKKYEKNI